MNSIIRKAMLEVLPTESFNTGNPPEPKELYIPSSHKKSLELYSNLIIGARGVGKSTWTTALADQNLRTIIGANIPELENAIVHIGFSEKPDQENYPTTDIFNELLQRQFQPYEIWKTIIIRWISHEINQKIPSVDWPASVSWVKENTESCDRILQEGNHLFKSKGQNGLVLFDALDRTSDNWESMDAIVRDLLRLVIRLKANTNIHTKVFLREDQFSRNVTNFPDASKLLSTKTELDWFLHDLHGLLWQLLCNATEEGGNILRNFYKEAMGVEPELKGDYWVISDEAKRDEAKQRNLFKNIAGSWMGKDKRRGVPYLWSVRHLSDGKGGISPRSFLAAIRSAVEDSSHRISEYPLHYESIKKGVQRASSIRINEMAEDYPWVKDVCEPLRNLVVPIEFTKIEERWNNKYPNGPHDIKSDRLPPQDLNKGWHGIQDELVRLGIFEENRDRRINMPDLYRVGFGLGRRGGVTPIMKEK